MANLDQYRVIHWSAVEATLNHLAEQMSALQSQIASAREQIEALTNKLERFKQPIVYHLRDYPETCPSCGDRHRLISNGPDGFVCYACWLLEELAQAEAQLAAVTGRVTCKHCGREIEHFTVCGVPSNAWRHKETCTGGCPGLPTEAEPRTQSRQGSK